MATVAAKHRNGKISVGRVFSRAFATIQNNAVPLIGIALLIGAIPSFLVTLVFKLFVPNATDAAFLLSSHGAAAYACIFFVYLMIGAFVEGAIIHVTLADLEGRRSPLSECLGVATDIFIPLVALSLLYTLGLILGFVFLIVPGLMVWCMWFVAKPVLVAERVRVSRAFKRSKELTAFEGWKILGILLVAISISVVGSQVARLIGRAIEGSDPVMTLPLSYVLLSIPVSTVGYVLWPTLQAATYIELRSAKEGGMRGHLEQVFA